MHSGAKGFGELVECGSEGLILFLAVVVSVKASVLLTVLEFSHPASIANAGWVDGEQGVGSDRPELARDGRILNPTRASQEN